VCEFGVYNSPKSIVRSILRVDQPPVDPGTRIRLQDGRKHTLSFGNSRRPPAGRGFEIIQADDGAASAHAGG
jgi:hypothetical protein